MTGASGRSVLTSAEHVPAPRLTAVWAGNFSVTEVKAILTDLKEQADAAKTYKRLTIALFFLMLVFLCAIMGQYLN